MTDKLITISTHALGGFEPIEATDILIAVRHAANGVLTQNEMLARLAKVAKVGNFYDFSGQPIPLDKSLHKAP